VLALIQINRAGHPIATSHEEPTKNAAGPENAVSSSGGDFRKTKPGGIEFSHRGISDGLAKRKEPSGWCSTSKQSISISHPKVQAQPNGKSTWFHGKPNPATEFLSGLGQYRPNEGHWPNDRTRSVSRPCSRLHFLCLICPRGRLSRLRAGLAYGQKPRRGSL
jgi:hypothetical protein